MSKDEEKELEKEEKQEEKEVKKEGANLESETQGGSVPPDEPPGNDDPPKP